jgi:hypothetical protein
MGTAYHLNMNRLIIMLMMALLPLRGWAGDLMSVQMATSSMSPLAASTMPADCPMLAKAKANPSSQAPSGVHGCTSCDLCIPIAESMNTQLEVVAVAADAGPPMREVDFMSATSTPSLRPPIS